MKELQKHCQNEFFNYHFQETSSVNGLQHENVEEMDLVKFVLLIVVTENEKPIKDFSGCLQRITKKNSDTSPYFDKTPKKYAKFFLTVNQTFRKFFSSKSWKIEKNIVSSGM